MKLLKIIGLEGIKPKNFITQMLACALFAWVFVSIPYESIRGGVAFVDRDNYEQTFLGKSYVLKKAAGSIKGYISNEVLWDFTVRSIIDYFSIEPLTALTAISYFVIFVMAVYVKRGAGWLWLIFLFNPLLIDFVMSQCRLAFAMGLFYLALLSKRKWIVFTVTLISLFIHTAMLPLTSFYWGGWLVYRSKLKSYPWVCLVCLFAMGAGLVLLMGPLQSIVGSVMAEDRRVGRYVGASTTLSYASYWLILLAVYCYKPKFNRIPNNAYATTLLVVFAGTVVFDLYGSRFIALALPCILCAMSMLDSSVRKMIIPSFSLYVGVQWLYWMKII